MKKVIVLLWWFILFGAGETKVGPFKIAAYCEYARKAVDVGVARLSYCFNDGFTPKEVNPPPTGPVIGPPPDALR